MKNNADMYEWAVPGDSGRQCLVDVDELLVDHSYQRREVSEQNTSKIAREFKWESFGSLVVMERRDRKKYVVDGQQRLLAAKKLGGIRRVPCIVFSSSGPKHEALAFISLNVRRAHVSAVAKFRAGVMSSTSPEKEIAAWLASQGLRVTEDGKCLAGVCFVARLIRTWNIDEAACKLAITTQRHINGTEPLHGDCHEGIWYLSHNGVHIEDYVDKLIALGGRPAMLRSIRATKIENDTSASIRACGLGVLRMVNHRLKHKINLGQTSET